MFAEPQEGDDPMARKFTLQDAEALAPLVRAILRDITSAHSATVHHRHRCELLHDCRHSKRYEVRRQYYESQAKLRAAERQFEELKEELEDLGVVLLDPVRGIVGFPFRLATKSAQTKSRRAYFLLKLADDANSGLRVWKRAGERHEHPIPKLWQEKQIAMSPFETDTPVV